MLVVARGCAPRAQRHRRVAPRCSAQLLADSATANLLAFSRAARIEAPLLAPASFGGLRGLAATGNIPAGSTVARVPHATVLETTSLPTAPPKPDLCPRDAWLALPWWARLALLLLSEDTAGASSPLAAYCAALPRSLDLPRHWTGAQLAALPAWSQLSKRVLAQQTELAAVHAALTAAAAAQPGCLAAGLSIERFGWAVDCVRSRTFSGPYEGSDASDRKALLLFIAALALVYTVTGAGPVENAASAALSCAAFLVLKDLAVQRLENAPRRYTLVPLVDLANHASGTVSDLAYEYFQDTFALVTGAPTPAGAQLLVSYGPLDADALLQFYGFVEAGPNAHDGAPIGALLAKGSAPRLEALRAAGALASLELLEVTQQGALVPPAAAQALRALVASDAEFTAKGPLYCASSEAVRAADAAALAALATTWPDGALAAAEAALRELVERGSRLRDRDAATEAVALYRVAKARAAAAAQAALRARIGKGA